MAEISDKEIKPGIFRTPDNCFAGLPGYACFPHHAEINGLRMHYLDEGEPGEQGFGSAIRAAHDAPFSDGCYKERFLALFSGAGHFLQESGVRLAAVVNQFISDNLSWCQHGNS